MTDKSVSTTEHHDDGVLDRLAEKPIIGGFVRFLTDDADDEKKPVQEEGSPKTPPPPGPATQPNQTIRVNPLPIPISTAGTVIDPVIKQNLEKAMRGESETPYIRFLKMCSKLGARISDRAQLFQTAFAAFSVDGATKATLLQAIDHHMTLLTTERSQFQEELGLERESRIGSRERESTEIDGQVRSIDQKIIELNAQKATLSQRKQAIEAEIGSENAVLAERLNSFTACYDELTNCLTLDKSDINTLVIE